VLAVNAQRCVPALIDDLCAVVFEETANDNTDICEHSQAEAGYSFSL
jgi:hypothetical protein